MNSKLRYFILIVSILILTALLIPSNLQADPTSQVQAFVTRFYVSCLNRTPDNDGLNAWTNWLLNKQKTGSDVVKGIVLSDEFKKNNYDNGTFVKIMYKAFFDRDPDDYGYKTWVDKLNIGVSRETVLNGFLKSQEFAVLCNNYGIIPFEGASTSNLSSNYSGTNSGTNSSIGTGSGFSGTKVNFIIWGDDSAFDRPGGRVSGRTDINVFVHLNLDTHKAILVPIPRDTWTPIPGYKNQKINGAHAIGGNSLAESTFESFTGIPIDFYAITDFDGFKPLIDFFGGVDVTVEEDIADSFSGCYLTKGTHHINGEQALALCRARHGRSLYGGGAYARETQAAMLLINLCQQKTGTVNIGNLPEFLNKLTDFLWTNISINQAKQILPVLASMGPSDFSIQKFNSWPQSFGSASAVGYNSAEKNQFFSWVAGQ
jgi:LCP family protein required for cell wall assembly